MVFQYSEMLRCQLGIDRAIANSVVVSSYNILIAKKKKEKVFICIVMERKVFQKQYNDLLGLPSLMLSYREYIVREESAQFILKRGGLYIKTKSYN